MIKTLEDRVESLERRLDAMTSPLTAKTVCKMCGGARFVCDVSVGGCPQDGSHGDFYHRRPCPECSAPKTEKCTATRRAASGVLLNCTRAPHDDVLLHLSVEGWLWAPEQVAPKTEEVPKPEPSIIPIVHEARIHAYHQSLGAKWMCEAIVRQLRSALHGNTADWLAPSRETRPSGGQRLRHRMVNRGHFRSRLGHRTGRPPKLGNAAQTTPP